MGYLIKQSATAQPLMFFMQDSAASRPLGKTGLSPTVTLSKNGGAFASPAGAVTEVANGWYKVAGNATDSATLGPLTLYATASGADPCTDVFGVVAYDPQDAAGLGLSRLDAAITSRMATFTLPTNFSSFSITAAGRVDVAAVGGTTQTARDLGASVLLSPGTGAGQISLTSGAVTAGTVSDKTGYTLTTSPPTAAAIRTEMETAGGMLELTKSRALLALPNAAPGTEFALPLTTDETGVVNAVATFISPNAITASALATDAVTEIAAGTKTAMEASGSLLNDLHTWFSGMVQAGAGALKRFTAAALALAPTGSGGGGGSSAPVLHVGPFSLTRSDTGLDGSMDVFVSDILGLRFDLTGQDERPISITGCTMTGTLTDAAGDEVASAVTVDTTDLNTDEGQVTATVTIPATVGTYQLTVTRTNGATDVKAFGPYALRVRAK